MPTTQPAEPTQPRPVLTGPAVLVVLPQGRKVYLRGAVADMVLGLIHYRARIEADLAGEVTFTYHGSSVKMKPAAALPVSSLELWQTGKVN